MMTNKTKRLLSLLAAGTMLMSAASLSMAEDAKTPNNDALLISTAVPISENHEQEAEAAFMKLTFKTLTDPQFGAVDGQIAVTSEESGDCYLALEFGAKLFDSEGNVFKAEDLKGDMTLTAYVGANTPMTMQFPPVYRPSAIVVETAELPFSTMAHFDEDLLDETNSLKLNLAETTVLVNQDGETVEADALKNQDLLVFYSITTRSIPAQTTPSKVVLFETETVEAEKTVVPLINVNNLPYLPLRQTAEAFDLSVVWIDETQSVMVGMWTMTIGEDGYALGRRMPDQLGAAPVLIDADNGFSNTYVPVSFFTDLLGATVEIDGYEATVSLPEAEAEETTEAATDAE